MTREIEFRAWDVLSDPPKMINPDECSEMTLDSLTTNELQVMQYTGLKDCDGKKIFKGDVLAFVGTAYKYIVKYEDAAFVLYHTNGERFGFLSVITSPTYENFEFKIIGNIHENPELLEEK